MAKVQKTKETETEAEASPSATLVRSSPRRAFCPLCGCVSATILSSDVRTLEDALCPGRCTVAWQALEAVRRHESASERVATRRRSEYENGQPHHSALSELLLLRWRAGDWTVVPEDVLSHFKAGQTAI
jgi:hypothetical protein